MQSSEVGVAGECSSRHDMASAHASSGRRSRREGNASFVSMGSDKLGPVIVRRKIRPCPLLAVWIRSGPGEEAVLGVLEDGDPG